MLVAVSTFHQSSPVYGYCLATVVAPKHLNKHVHSRVCVVDAGWPYVQRNQTRCLRNHNVLCIS